MIMCATLAALATDSATAQQSGRTLVKEWREGDYIVRRYMVSDDEPHVAEYEILYAINRAEPSATFEHNDEAMKRIDDFFAELKGDSLRHIKSITITGYASPDGTPSFNTTLARERAQQLSKLLRDRYALSGNYDITITSHVEPWSATAPAIEHSTLANRTDLVRMVSTNEPPMTIDNRLKKHSSAWSYLTADVLPEMRRATVAITYTEDELTDSREYSPEREVIVVEEVVMEEPRHKHHKHNVEIVDEWEGVIIDLGATGEGYCN